MKYLPYFSRNLILNLERADLKLLNSIRWKSIGTSWIYRHLNHSYSCNCSSTVRIRSRRHPTKKCSNKSAMFRLRVRWQLSSKSWTHWKRRLCRTRRSWGAWWTTTSCQRSSYAYIHLSKTSINHFGGLWEVFFGVHVHVLHTYLSYIGYLRI